MANFKQHGVVIKGKGRRRRIEPVDSVTPHNCVILNIDGALNSGWAIYLKGSYDESGECREDGIEFVVQKAVDLATAHQLPLVLVLEKQFNRNAESAATLIRVQRAWRAAWKKLAKGHANKITIVYPATWRSRVIFATSGPELRDKEGHVAREVVDKADVGADEAAAICIGLWSAASGAVAKLLPQKWWGEAPTHA